jgi:hypothetical protein
MKISTNVRTGKKVQLTSWKSPSDPSIGSFSAVFMFLVFLKLSFGKKVAHIGAVVHGTVKIFIGIPNMYSVFRDGFTLVDDKEGTFYLTFLFEPVFLDKFCLE